MSQLKTWWHFNGVLNPAGSVMPGQAILQVGTGEISPTLADPR